MEPANEENKKEEVQEKVEDKAEQQEDEEEEKAKAKDEYEWPPLEGDPEIFTKYMKTVGLEKGNFNEIFSMEKEMLDNHPKNVRAIIFAFRRKESIIDNMTPTNAKYFMFQEHDLDDACGVIACLHGIFNNLDKFPLKPNSPLEQLWKLVENQSPLKCSEIVSGFQQLKEAHHDAADEGQSDVPESQDEVKYHFVCFIVDKAKQLVYLDGCKETPLMIKPNVKEEDLIYLTIELIKSWLADNKIEESFSIMTLNSEI